MAKAKWHDGIDYPDCTSLATAFRKRAREKRLSVAKYGLATAGLAIAIWWITGQTLVVVAAIPFLVGIIAVVCSRERKYRAFAAAAEAGCFEWASGKMEDKYQRHIMEINATPKYQVRVSGEWMEADAVTFIECEIGNPVVMVTFGDDTVGIPVAKKVVCSARKRLNAPLLASSSVS